MFVGYLFARSCGHIRREDGCTIVVNRAGIIKVSGGNCGINAGVVAEHVADILDKRNRGKKK